jgi:glycosyltransferase involved in cell wall biosynthesis
MNVLLVSQAKYGVRSVISNVVPHLSQRDDVECSYLTLPIHDAPEGCDQISLLKKTLLKNLEGRHLPYLGYAVLGFWQRAYRYLAKNGDTFDVIWLHNPRLLPLVPQQFTNKYLVTYHNHLFATKAQYYDFPASLYYHLFGRIEHRGIEAISRARFTVVHERLTDELVDVGVSPQSAVHVGNGVDIEKFHPDVSGNTARDAFDLPDGKLFLSLGSLTEQKRPLALLKVFASFAEETNEESVVLAVAGDGPLRDEAETFVRQRDLDNVRFLGFVDEQLKPSLYAAADCFLLASQYDPGGPLTLYEAAASGLPCITSDIPNFEWIEQNECGITVDFDAPSDAAESIRSFLHSLDGSYASTARQYAKSNLGWQDKADEYFTEFRKISEKQ